MRIAEQREGQSPGNRPWLKRRQSEIESIFLIPRLKGMGQWGGIRCTLLVLSDKNHGAWMNLDVQSWEIRRLVMASRSEIENIALNLAVRLPVVRSPDDPLFDPGVEFGE